MEDQPTPAKIILKLANANITGEEFIGLSGSLYRQNLIYSQPSELRRNKNTLELMVIFRDLGSFKHWFKNTEIEKFWHPKFEQLLLEKPKTVKEQDVIIELDQAKNCSCKQSDFYILQGRTFQFSDELTCNKCLGQVSYSKVPLEIPLEDWQNKYERVYLNWLESSLFEKEAHKELTNYKKGKLNLAGEQIRQQLADHFNIPVYMSYFESDSSVNHPCLICGQEGISSGLNSHSKICKTCNTVFD